MDRNLRIASLIIFSLLSLSILDSCTAIGDRGKMVRGLRGAPIYVSGNLDSSGSNLERLAAAKNTPQDLAKYIQYETDNVSGFLELEELTGRMWRGVFTVREDSHPGDYSLTVHQKGVPVTEATSKLKIRIFPDETTLRADMETFSERIFGFKPWWITMAVFPCGVLLLWLSYQASTKYETELQAKGIGTIYRMAKSGKGWAITFGLGSSHGVYEGAVLALLDISGKYVGTIIAQEVEATTSVASVGADIPLKPKFLVSLETPRDFHAGDPTA